MVSRTSGGKRLKLSVIVPVYNEEKTICALLDRVAHAPIKCGMEIIVINDGSRDSSPERINEFYEKFRKSGYGCTMKVIHKTNGGKGSAIAEGLKQADGDIILIQDADLEYFPEDYGALLDPMLKGHARVVYGSRFMGRYIPHGMTLKNWIGNMVLNVTAWVLFSWGSVTDLATCYKIWFREDIPTEDLACKGFEFCPVHFANAWKRGLKPFEVPIRFQARWYEDGKKITTMNGFYELWTLIKLGFKYGRFSKKRR
jgi:glycosyltransferase involved in cell wall biosynthesis